MQVLCYRARTRHFAVYFSCIVGLLIFSIIGVAFIILVVMMYRAGQNRRQVRPSWIESESPIFSSRTFVRQYSYPQWISWNYRYGGGPELIVWLNGVEVSAPQGTMASSRAFFFDPHECLMTHDRVGLWGMPIDRRECIRLVGPSEYGEVTLALTPDAGIEPAWQALLRAGVRPREGLPLNRRIEISFVKKKRDGTP